MKPIFDILNTPLTKPKPIPPVIEGTQVFHIPRSGWSGFFIFLGCVGILIAGISILVALSSDSTEQTNISVALIIVGIAGAIQSFFLSFLINVFTDMRWLLSQIAGKQKETK
jgi:hypothetical protein